MSSAKRVYLYGIALASLVMMVWGGADLVHLLLEHLVRLSLPAAATSNPSEFTERLSRSLATVAIGLPVWAVHWRWAQRAAYAGRHVDRTEISALPRKLYLHAVIFVGAINLVLAIHDLVNDALSLGFNQAPADWLDDYLLLPIAVILTRTPIWLFHARVAARDRSHGGDVGAGLTIRRWNIYALAMLGLVAWLVHANELLQDLVDVLAGQSGARDTGRGPWGSILSDSLPWLIPGLILWLIAWTWSNRLAAAVAQPSSDRSSALRKLYLYAVLFISISATIWNLAQLLQLIIRTLLITPESDTARLTGMAREAVVPILVYGATWAYHARAVRREAALWPEQARQSTVRWTYEYLVAFVGALTLGGGLTELLASLVINVLGLETSIESARLSLSGALTASIVGFVVWYLHWRRMQREAADPAAEALISSGPRRAYIFLSIGISVLALLAAGAFLIYQVMQVLLGSALTASATRELIQSVSAAIVATGFLLYHGHVLRRDTERRGATAAQKTALVAIAQLDPEADGDAIRTALESLELPGARLDVLEVDASTAREILGRRGAEPSNG